MMVLAHSDAVHPQVNAVAASALRSLRADLLKAGNTDTAREMVRRIDHFFEHPEQFKVPKAPEIPDGSPIGMACFQ